MRRVAMIVTMVAILTTITLSASNEVHQHIYRNTVKVMYVSEFKDIFGNEIEETPYGSGVYIEGNRIITSYHLPKGKPVGKFKIYASDGNKTKELEGTIEKYNDEFDLMILKLDKALPWEPVRIATEESEFDEKIYFGGHSGFPLPTIRVIQKMSHKIHGIYLDPLYFGDSGGGVFNANGELEGIIYMTFKFNGVPALVGYAIPLKKLKEFLKKC